MNCKLGEVPLILQKARFSFISVYGQSTTRMHLSSNNFNWCEDGTHTHNRWISLFVVGGGTKCSGEQEDLLLLRYLCHNFWEEILTVFKSWTLQSQVESKVLPFFAFPLSRDLAVSVFGQTSKPLSLCCLDTNIINICFLMILIKFPPIENSNQKSKQLSSDCWL